MTTIGPTTTTQPIIEQHRIVRQRAFAVSGRISPPVILSILDELAKEHVTGKIIIHLAQGAPIALQCEESAKINLDSTGKGMRNM